MASQDAVLVLSLRVAKEGVDAAPVHKVAFLPGIQGTPGGEDCLLVLGGQAITDPEMLTLLPLDPGGTTASLTVPWFGNIKAHALVRTLPSSYLESCTRQCPTRVVHDSCCPRVGHGSIDEFD